MMPAYLNLGELKGLVNAFQIGWEQSRTILFCSFGMEDVQTYSAESWISKHMNIINQRSVAYVSVEEPIQGFDHLDVHVNSLLKDVLSNMSALVVNPDEKKRFEQKKTLFDVWQHISDHQSENHNEYRHFFEETENLENNRPMIELHHETQTTVSELFESLGVPTIRFHYGSRNNDGELNNVSAFEYERSIHQLWTLVIFSLADHQIIPFNLVTYSTILENFSVEVEKLELQKNTSLTSDINTFIFAIKNAIPAVQKFQKDVQSSTVDDIMKRRFLNDKLMLLGKLFTCVRQTMDLLLAKKFEHEVFADLKKLETSVKRGINCVGEMYSAVQSIYY